MPLIINIPKMNGLNASTNQNFINSFVVSMIITALVIYMTSILNVEFNGNGFMGTSEHREKTDNGTEAS